jgi:hypothetical protein
MFKAATVFHLLIEEVIQGREYFTSNANWRKFKTYLRRKIK